MRLKLVVGASVEAFSENDWWDAKIREVTDSEVKVFYIGGSEDDAEWISLDETKTRLRAPRAGGRKEAESEEVDANPMAWTQGIGGMGGDMDEGINEDEVEEGGSRGRRKERGGGGKGDRRSSGKSPKQTSGGRDKGEVEEKPMKEKATDLGRGWWKERMDRGQYRYYSPDGEVYPNLHKAQEAAAMKANKRGGAGGGGAAEKPSPAKPAGKGSDKKKKDRRKSRVEEEEEEEEEPHVPPTREKTGGCMDKAFLTDYDKDWHWPSYEIPRKWLVENGLVEVGGDLDSTKTLSFVTATLQHAMHLHLGKDAPKTKRCRMTRIPHKLFLDYSEGGSVCCILQNMIEYMGEKQLEVEELEKHMLSQAKSDSCKCMEVFLRLNEALKARNAIPRPNIYFSPELVDFYRKEELEKYRRMVSRKPEATLVSSEAKATHIVVPNNVDMADVEDCYCREIVHKHVKKDNLNISYVHWWFFPDSYDEWIPKSEVAGDADEVESKKKQYTVCLRWLRDTDKYNEWMNEEDYEPDPDAEQLEPERLQQVQEKEKEPTRWSEQEDKVLRENWRKLKGRDDVYGRLAKLLPGRTAAAVKARVHSQILAKKHEKGEKREREREGELESAPRKKKKKKRAREEQEEDEEEVLLSGFAGDDIRPKRERERNKGASSAHSQQAKVKQRILSVNHACWDTQEDYKAALLAEPQVWDLPLCEEGWAGDGEESMSVVEEERGEGAPLTEGAMLEGGAGGRKEDGLPLLLPSKASWFDLAKVNEIEISALPEYFDGQVPHKTPESYRWHRDCIISVWMQHLAHALALHDSHHRKEESRQRGRGGRKRKAGGRGGGWGGEEEGALRFEQVQRLPVSRCLQLIPGHAPDILRVFEALEQWAVINHTLKEDQGGEEGAPTWTAAEAQRLVRAYKTHGPDWPAILPPNRGEAECVVAVAAAGLRGTMLARAVESRRERREEQRLRATENRSEEDRRVQQQADFLQEGLGCAAAAAAVDVVLQEERRERASVELDQEGASRGGSGGGSEAAQVRACKAVLLARAAVRARVLAHEEGLEVRRLVTEAIDLQLHRIQVKAAALLQHEKVLATLKLRQATMT